MSDIFLPMMNCINKYEAWKKSGSPGIFKCDVDRSYLGPIRSIYPFKYHCMSLADTLNKNNQISGVKYASMIDTEYDTSNLPLVRELKVCVTFMISS